MRNTVEYQFFESPRETEFDSKIREFQTSDWRKSHGNNFWKKNQGFWKIEGSNNEDSIVVLKLSYNLSSAFIWSH